MPNPTPNYLILGQLLREFLVTPDQTISLDQPGGNLLYAAGGLSLWLSSNETAGLVARVGENYPRTWVEDLQAKGYSTAGIKVLPEEIDLRYFRAYEDLRTMVEEDPIKVFARLESSMPRALLGYQPPSHRGGSADLKAVTSVALRKTDLPEAYIGAGSAHICPMDYLSQSLMPAELRAAGVEIVTLDPGNFMQPEHYQDVRALLIGLTAFLPSEDELTSLFRGRTANIWEMIEEVASWGVEVIAVKRAWRGQLLFDTAKNRRVEIPAYPSKMVDPTGAGDVFAGGFLRAFSKYGSPLDGLLHGNVAASIAVEGRGPFYTREVLPGLAHARLNSLRDSIREV
ncbi:MAG: carbohydrate kinase family protein [Chloroflexota bacterium]